MFIDDSLGDLGSFTRKVKTEARWEGARLILLCEPFGETLNNGVPGRVAGSITRVWTLSLSGEELRLERTGYRVEPPRLLHGRPYSRADDLVYNRDVTIYGRSQ
ncbi:MAG: hypothetical protein R2745_01990 [Vicinamibacterales bacterium]